ncbi:MAG TPA: N-acetyl-gamma-glutamyl-phosphate reductase [Ignavibacteriales bacterium]|nr:N-acetyl-gamma-glutamyl-phosphate reductase [Ignavibacteriales bacterium]HPD66996.1 N-acetyl-gamma-glutamyl-phosphate reductase [Ignavibacteriales bacterium]HRR18844.1 N-acetyl-gamma-glutamyl-phosphate reductase [Ignavibacteriales bacterium]HRT98415.1 N-acetyl-gamma-glutamyl-phosphate reductase [Ignavibacteriales bacterium]
MKKVAIIGGTGYTGYELIKFLLKHKYVSDFDIFANSSAGKKLLDIFPEFENILPNDKTIFHVDEFSNSYDVVFLALPHQESHNLVPKIINSKNLIIDLGGDFRLDNKELYTQWYNFEHKYQNLLDIKTYGLCEIVKDYKSNLIANPGCYPTSVLLALIPIVNNFSDLIESISVVSYSGTSGAGKSAKQELLLSEMYGNVKAYNVLKHRHEVEIHQELKKFGFQGNFVFTTHLLPITRGIYSTCNIFLKYSVKKDDIKDAFYQHYNDKPFIRLRNTPPEIKWVANTNFCDIFFDVRDNTIVVNSTIDNLVKGASGQAIQNMNLFFQFEQTTSLL